MSAFRFTVSVRRGGSARSRIVLVSVSAGRCAALAGASVWGTGCRWTSKLEVQVAPPSGGVLQAASGCPSATEDGRSPLVWCLYRPVLKHGPRSLTCTRVEGWQTPRRNESKGGLASLRWDLLPRGERTTGPYRSPLLCGLVWSKSVHVGTRKMVNYAWVG